MLRRIGAPLALVLLVLGALTGVSTNTAGAGNPKTVSVPLLMRGGPGTGTQPVGSAGISPVATIRIGSSGPLHVILDTGSEGLHLYAGGALKVGNGSGVTLTSTPDLETYGDNEVDRGVVATGRLSIGSLSTSQPIRFGYIAQASCLVADQRCPASGGTAGYVNSGIDGVMGIGFDQPTGGLGNPLQSLPAPYSKVWTIWLSPSSGSLQLGAGAPKASHSVVLPLHDGLANVCFGFKPVTTGRFVGCYPTVFDTGAVFTWVQNPRIPGQPGQPGATVAAGVQVTLTAPGSSSPLASFAAGLNVSANVVVGFPDQVPMADAGLDLYFLFVTTWNPGAHTLTLTPGPGPGSLAQSTPGS